jgi:hypothetical protein
MKKSIIDNILSNIAEDRKKVDEYLDSISNYIDNNGSAISGDEYSKIMTSAAKLLETSQKSNEQIVKLLEINKKFKPKKVKDNQNLTQEDIEKLYKGDVVEI